MKLVVLEGELGVARLAPAEPTPAWATRGRLTSVTRTSEELSVVCAAADIPENVTAERGWRALRVAGRLDFALTGVLASIAAPLAAARISIFVVSTYDTDYILVRAHGLAAAVQCLTAAGHDVADDPGLVPPP